MTQDQLIIRYGVWGNAVIPLSAIESVTSHAQAVKRSNDSLRFCQFGYPNVCIILKPDTFVQTAFGYSMKTKIYLGLDKPYEFIKEFN